MERKKFDILNIFLNKIIFGIFIGLLSLTLKFAFSQNSFAEYKATLSASINETTAAIDGTEIIESSDETAEHEINLKINTTNKTGYTAMISSKTEETALLNTDPAINTKINSISSNYSLANFPANTWGYRFDDNVDFSPIPAQSAPVNLIKTTEKSTEEENYNIKLGMKLNSSLKPGNYENRLIVSVVSNPYIPKAIMTEGPDFNKKLQSLLENEFVEMKYFRRSLTAPASTTNVANIENEDSECEIKLWADPNTESVYYYTEPEKVYLNTDSSQMFYSGYSSEKIQKFLELDLSNFNTSQVTSMYSMFLDMFYLTTLNLSSFDTSNVTNMSDMFYGMSNLATLNLSNFDTSKVTDMEGMFSYIYNLTTLDLSNFYTSKVTNMKAMFSYMSELTTLNLSNFDTSKVTNMSYMFYGMSNLANLDLSSFNISNVTDMSCMFSGMPNLINLDISNFDTSHVTSMYGMFYLKDEDILKDKLEKIYVNNDFNTAKLTDFSRMFKNRKKLRGGAGSYLTDPSTADKTWLRIDDPTNGRPGYFTRKP